MYSNELNSIGLPVNVYSTSLGRILTSTNFQKYNCIEIDRANEYKITVSGLENTAQNAADLLQFWQNIDNWAQYYPESVTPIIQRLTDVLLMLRKASTTDAPYDFYELVMFWNTAYKPEYFAPVIFTDSVYNSLINNALSNDYRLVYTQVQNLVKLTEDPKGTLINVTDSYPDYVIPDLPPITINSPDGQNVNDSKRVFFFFTGLLLLIIILK